jgi:hypothetical protein
MAESLAVGTELEVDDGLQTTRIVRRDASPSATADQPKVWTFIEFQAEDDRAADVADALAGVSRCPRAPARLGLIAGGDHPFRMRTRGPGTAQDGLDAALWTA